MKFRGHPTQIDLSRDLACVIEVRHVHHGGLISPGQNDPERFRPLIERVLRIRQRIEIVDLRIEPDWMQTPADEICGLIGAPIDDHDVLILGFRSTLDRVDDGLIDYVIELHRQLRGVRRHLRGREDEVARWVGISAAHEAILRKVEIAATAEARVLVIGEPGVGRHALARSIIARRGKGSVTESVEAALRFEGEILVLERQAFESLQPETRHRLEEFRIEIPRLADRIEDGHALAESTLGRCLEPAEEQALEAYDWPGNFRELKFTLWRLEHLGVTLGTQIGPRAVLTEDEFRELEKANIERALAACEGTVYGKNGAAAMLGINATTLASRIKSLDIDR